MACYIVTSVDKRSTARPVSRRRFDSFHESCHIYEDGVMVSELKIEAKDQAQAAQIANDDYCNRRANYNKWLHKALATNYRNDD